MSQHTIRLHHKLYRAKAIDRAMGIASESDTGAELTRRRDGDHHVVAIDGPAGEDFDELLREVGDLALQITLELDQRA